MSKNVGFKVDDTIANGLETIYPSLNAAATRAVKSWGWLRTRTLRELVGVFTKEELLAVINSQNGTFFDPRFAFKEYLYMTIRDQEEYFSGVSQFKADVGTLINKIETISEGQCFFLIEWAYQFWYENLSEQQDLDKWIGDLLAD